MIERDVKDIGYKDVSWVNLTAGEGVHVDMATNLRAP
jgi:hypothetical protein